MVSLLATTCALHAPLALWFDRRGSPSAAPRADEGFDQVLQLSAHAAPTGPCLRVTPESRLEEEGRVLGAALHVRNAQEQSAALALVGSVEWILVEAGAPQPCIVAENLLAATEGSPTRVAVCVDSAAGVPGLAFALQRGVDALVCPAEAATGALLEALHVAKAQRLEVADPPAPAAAAATAEPTAVELRQARVLGVYEGGVADRVALDFTTLLGDDEGALVGSAATELVLVLGETVASGFVPPRPFRVNAGPVHAYVLMADGSTKYLSECRAGDAVLIACAGGGGRAAVVGRCKVEPRPTLRVEFETSSGGGGGGGGGRASVFLQQAETVRLATGGGPTPVTALVARSGATSGVGGMGGMGDQGGVGDAEEICGDAEEVLGDVLLVRSTGRGTHVGRAIGGRVAER